jgi:SAM-dependent methyltransferase
MFLSTFAGMRLASGPAKLRKETCVPLARVFRRVITASHRRGFGYGRYLLTGVLLPRLARFCAGPLRLWSAGRGLHRAAETSRLAAAEGLVDSGTTTDHVASASRSTAADVEALMNRAHARGFTGVRHVFDAIAMSADGAARFRYVKGLRHHPRRGVVFAADRDADRIAFNARYHQSILTEKSARRLLRERKANVPSGYRDYAPIDFGGGLTIGRFAATDSGTGRWDFFNGPLVAPLIAGRRVLDLGSNNGSLPLMMLRAGARAVVAIEGTPAIADFARLNASILEWRDIRSYDIEVLTADMRVFLTEDLGSFDVITAFCSLYYLPEPDMARVVAKAASMGATLVLQANDAIRDLPASGEELRRLMSSNGYPNVTMHQFAGFARPLLVGTPQRAGDAAVSDGAVEAVGFSGT